MNNEISFSFAIDRIQKLSEEVEKCDLENFISIISEMLTMKNYCLSKLQQEKAEMEEIV